MRDEYVYLVGLYFGGVYCVLIDVVYFECCLMEDCGIFELYKWVWVVGILGESDLVDVLLYGIGLFVVVICYGWFNVLKWCFVYYYCGCVVGEDEVVVVVVYVYCGG